MSFDFATLAPLAGSLARAGLPALGTVLGVVLPPPFDLVASGAFKLISAAMGVDPATPNAPVAVQAAVDADPAAAVAKLQTVEQAHKDAADAVNEELRIRTADTQNARSFGAALVTTTPNWTRAIAALAAPMLGVIVTIGFVGVTLAVILHAVDQGPTAIYMVTTLGSAFLTLVFYYFGTSQSSAGKTDVLADLARSPTVNAQPGSRVSSGVITGRR